MRAFNKVLAVFVLATLPVAAGCPSKKGPGDIGPGGISDSDLGSGSLDRFRSGRDAAEGGPLRDVYFAYDQHNLDEAARSALQQNSEWLRENASARVEIEGHCDERGTVEYNLALGARRAKSAKDYMVALGISADRLSTISYGEELPVCQDAAESCWSRNRRAHFVVLR